MGHPARVGTREVSCRVIMIHPMGAEAGSQPRRPAYALHPAMGAASAVVGAVAMVTGVVVFGRTLRFPLRASLVLGSILLVLPGLLAVLAAGRPLRATLAWSGGGPRTLALAAGLGVGLWVLSLGLLELQFAVWPPPPGYIEGFRALHAALKSTGPLDWLWSLAAIAVAPALCEELLVRGIVLPSFRAAFGTGLAVAGSALVFAAIHLDAYRFLFTLVAGIVLGAIRVRTEVLGPSMLAHGLLNTLTFVAAPFLDDPTEPLPDPRPLLGLALFVGGFVATALLMRRLRRVDPPLPPA
jgi:membrane protease YdiL (CAAX protease family)